MAKSESKSKSDPRLDVLILGEHPATYLCAMLLKQTGKLRVIHSTIPEEKSVDRTCLLNPAFFSLHKPLESLKRKIDLTPIYGVQFLADDPQTRSECRGKSTAAFTVGYKDFRAATMKLASDEGIELATPKQLQIHRLDEHGVDVTLGKATLRPRVLVVGGCLPESQQKLLGMPESWGPEVVHRYTFVKLKGSKWAELGNRPTIPMSLDLRKELTWAWLLPCGGGIQLAVEQPIETTTTASGPELLRYWAQTLRHHGILKSASEIHSEAIDSLDLPLAGALAHEGVANRTLLIGPAGGFFSSTGEDLYPNCWSAIYAVEVLKKALKEPHLQDAIQAYRQRWRTTLGDYLRGPQQNLRFLLPLVYRNQVMTDRLSDAILLGKAMVR